MKINLLHISLTSFLIFKSLSAQDGSGSEGDWHALYIAGEGNQSVVLAADEEAWITRLDYTWGVGKLGTKNSTVHTNPDAGPYYRLRNSVTSNDIPDIRVLFQNPGDSGMGTIHTGKTFGYADRIWVPGPRTIYLTSGTANAIVTCHIVVKKKANEVTKKFATVIPENASGNMSIILEQSTDLINWTAASPGSFAPNSAKRFFRVRSQED